jgi:microcystin-dependent protein
MDNYIGEIRAFAGNFAPEGWALCNGGMLEVRQYEQLFSLIGTTFGGNGVTTFGLPDLRGRLMINRGQGTSPYGQLTSYQMGQKAGTENVTLGVTNITPHTHTLHAYQIDAVSDNPNNQELAGPIDVGQSFVTEMYLPPNVSPLTRYKLGDQTIRPSDEQGMPHDNLMPFLCISYIIALQGIDPTFS